ncbi:hypothetical protein AB6A40_010180 [Gnathostoma spinigerum]|uniref:Uncharacterized protein n=1 Tax=Gnathostoma spinigerum TaxID=75299 RepID=A0ABD6F0M6_9BILA
MTEDVEQYNRKAKRIRDNIIDALGPYHVTSDIIVNTQHGPVNSGLFGIMQSPINSLSSVRFPNSSNDSIGDERLSTARCLETMKDVAPPLSVIETTLPFSKKPLIGQIGLICDGKMSMPSTSGNYDRTSDLKQSNNMRRKSEEEDTRKRRKRKKSNDFTNGDQFERSERYNGVRDMGRPCSSLNNAKVIPFRYPESCSEKEFSLYSITN